MRAAATAPKVTVTDDDGGSGNDQVVLTFNAPPTVDAGPDRSGAEGSPIQLNGTVTDPDSTPTITWTYTLPPSADPGMACTFSDTHAVAPTITCNDDGAVTATLTAADGVNPPVSSTATVTVANANPVVTITAPAGGSFARGSLNPVVRLVHDELRARNDTHTPARSTWGDVHHDLTEAPSARRTARGTCTGNGHTYAAASGQSTWSS